MKLSEKGIKELLLKVHLKLLNEEKKNYLATDYKSNFPITSQSL